MNKTGYSHIIENKKKFFHFLTWELVEKNLTPIVFFKFSPEPVKIFWNKIRYEEEKEILDKLNQFKNTPMNLSIPKGFNL